jgi:hypothetical protein
MTGVVVASIPTSNQVIAIRDELIAALGRIDIVCAKKRAGPKPCSKTVSTLFTRMLDLFLTERATLLVRVRAPPETWTTRLSTNV